MYDNFTSSQLVLEVLTFQSSDTISYRITFYVSRFLFVLSNLLATILTPVNENFSILTSFDNLEEETIPLSDW